MVLHTHRVLRIFALTYLLLAVGMSFSYAQKKNKKEPVQLHTRNQPNARNASAVEGYFMDGMRYALTEDYDKAAIAFEQVLRLDPKNSAAHYKMAEILMNQDKFEQAIPYAKQATALDKNNEWYYMLLAETYLRAGNANEAAATVESMLNRTKASPQNYLKLAQLYLQQNQLDKALIALNKAEKHLGIDEGIVELKQRIYLNQNKVTEALQEGEKLIAHFPTESTYALRQAQLLLNVQRHSEAQKHLITYLETNPEDPQAQFLLAKTYENQEQYGKANDQLLKAFSSPDMAIEPKLQEMAQLIGQLPDESLEKSLPELTQAILQAHPQDARAYAIAGDFLIATNQKESARNHYRKALALDESNFNVWQNVLTLGLELARYDSVARESDQALMLFPNQASLYFFNGSANLSLNNYNEAALALEQGKRLAASNKQLTTIFNSHLGDAYNGLKRYDLSDASYEAALALEPNNAYILNNYSYYLALRKDKLSLALDMSKKLIEQHPNDPNYLDTHAWVLYQMKQYDKSRHFLEKALEHAQENDGTIIEHYGDVLYRLGRQEEAVKQWLKAKEKNRTSEFIDKKIKDKKLYE